MTDKAAHWTRYNIFGDLEAFCPRCNPFTGGDAGSSISFHEQAIADLFVPGKYVKRCGKCQNAGASISSLDPWAESLWCITCAKLTCKIQLTSAAKVYLADLPYFGGMLQGERRKRSQERGEETAEQTEAKQQTVDRIQKEYGSLQRQLDMCTAKADKEMADSVDAGEVERLKILQICREAEAFLTSKKKAGSVEKSLDFDSVNREKRGRRDEEKLLDEVR